MSKKKDRYNNKFKQRMNEIPVENQRTAAWANIEKFDQETSARIFNPDDLQVENAKEYVDENEK